MCRLLAIKSKCKFSVQPYLISFAEMCKESKEFQGHGWGCSVLTDFGWKVYKNIKPIWEDEIPEFGPVTQLLAHARSAFRDEGIIVENNMPFNDAKYQFIFNGELQGVTIKESGRIGAEKIFNYLKRFDKGNTKFAIKKGVDVINKKTRYIRAMNIIISDAENLYVNNMYNEDPDYFNLTIHQKADFTAVCSQKLNIIDEWTLLPNNTIKVI